MLREARAGSEKAVDRPDGRSEIPEEGSASAPFPLPSPNDAEVAAFRQLCGDIFGVELTAEDALRPAACLARLFYIRHHAVIRAALARGGTGLDDLRAALVAEAKGPGEAGISDTL